MDYVEIANLFQEKNVVHDLPTRKRKEKGEKTLAGRREIRKARISRLRQKFIWGWLLSKSMCRH